MNRLPQELRLIISREIGDVKWHIDEIMTIVERKISARERELLLPSVVRHMGQCCPQQQYC